MEIMIDCFDFLGIDKHWDSHLCEEAAINLLILIQLNI